MAKAKVKFSVPKDLEKKVKERIDQIIQEDEILLDLGKITQAEMIKSILQAKEPGSGQPFKNREITPAWKKRKKALSQKNSPIDSRAGGGSNLARLAFTGQFLKSFKSKIEKTKGGRKQLAIGPEGERKRYIGVKGKPLQGKMPSNDDLGTYLRDQGRDWKQFPEKMRQRLTNLVRAYIRRKLRSQK